MRATNLSPRFPHGLFSSSYTLSTISPQKLRRHRTWRKPARTQRWIPEPVPAPVEDYRQPWTLATKNLDHIFGADEIVRDGKSLSAAGGADIILSTSNSTKSMMDSMQGLRPDGRFVVMGADAEPLSIWLIELLFKRIKIMGSRQNGPEYLYEALDYVARGF